MSPVPGDRSAGLIIAPTDTMRMPPFLPLVVLSLGIGVLVAQEEGPEGLPPLPDPVPLQVEVEVQGEGQVQIEVEVQGEGKAGLKIEIPVPPGGDPRAPGFLGVSAAELPAALAEKLKIDHGVRLTEVNADSPAGKAGLKVDDIILGVNDRKVENMLQLRDAITAHKQGDEVTLELIHKGERVKKKVTLAARPALPRIVLPPGAFQGGGIQRVPNGIQRLQRFGLGEDGRRFKMRDNDGTVEVAGAVEEREVTVWDMSNKVIYEGPWVTPQDKAAPPGKIRKRIERVEKTFALRLQRPQPFVLPQREPPRPRVRPKAEENPKPGGKDGEPGK